MKIHITVIIYKKSRKDFKINIHYYEIIIIVQFTFQKINNFFQILFSLSSILDP
jgi:hypothetical protein